MTDVSTTRRSGSMVWKPALMVVGALALGACATVPMPQSLQGSYASLSPAKAAQGNAAGAHVRWGGRIVATTFTANQTCFYVLARPLNSAGRPSSNAYSDSYFEACHPGIYNPTIYRKYRKVTFTGVVNGTVSQVRHTRHFTYPRLAAQVVYLWPSPSPVAVSCPYDDCNKPSRSPMSYGQAAAANSARALQRQR